MITKLYDKIKKIIYENYKFILGFFILFLAINIELPYYINSPGGIIDISKKIKIDSPYKPEGSFNFAYVTEIKATIPTLLIAYFNKEWDILKREDVIYDNETEDDIYFRKHLLLDEANQNAIILAYQKANKKVDIIDQQLFITFVDTLAKTDLKVGDEVLEINNQVISNKEQISKIVAETKMGTKMNIKVKRDDQIVECYAEPTIQDNKKIIGIMITQKRVIETDPHIELKFKASESGSSGGLMMALTIYNYLTEEDITHGYDIVGTGTIDENGNVGSIGGVEYKLRGVIKAKKKIFLVPAGENYEEAMELKKKENFDIEIVPISTFDEALEYLNTLK